MWRKCEDCGVDEKLSSFFFQVPGLLAIKIKVMIVDSSGTVY